MRFSLSQDIDAPVEMVEATLVDPDFLAHLGTLPKLGTPDLLDQRDDGDLLHQRVRYAFAGDLPSVARRFIDPKRLTWIEESTLDRRTHETVFTIKPDHYSGLLRCSGTFRMSADGATGTHRQAEGDLSVSIPLVGRKAEEAIVSGLHERAEMEATIVEEWLTRGE